MTYYTADLIYHQGQLLKDHFIDVQEGRLVQAAHLERLDPRAFRDMVAFEDALLMPGLVNSHTHSFQSLYRHGMALGESHSPNPASQPESLSSFYGQLSLSDLYTSALFAYSQMLKQGITTVCDFAYLHDESNAACEQLIKAAEVTGIRVVLARALSDKASLSKRFEETTDDALARTETLIQQTQGHPLVRVIPSILSLQSASKALLLGAAQLARQYDRVFQIQVANSLEDRQMVLDSTGQTPVQYLADLGVLSERTLLVHATWLDDAEVALLKESGAGVVYTPSGSMASGGGITRVQQLREAGVRVALGTGSASQNSRLSLLEEMRLASYSQKAVHHNAWQATPADLLSMGMEAGAQQFGLPLGAFEPGALADFVVVDLEDLSMQPRPYVASNLIFSMTSSAINAVYVNGRRVLDTGELLNSAESSLPDKIRRSTYNQAYPTTV